MLDNLNERIIDILQSDGRASNASIARSLGVSEGTIRRRLNTLIEEDIVNVNVSRNPEKLGFATKAIIGVQVDPDKIDLVGEGLAKLEEIDWVSVTTGSFDIFAWVTLESAEKLGVFLKTRVGTISGVRKTETFICLSMRKDRNRRI
jgi:Lrp/AsnC family transcriptional regulator for asnA, asnC and gidA